MLDATLGAIRNLIPGPIFRFFQPAYHLSLSFLAALWYGFPSRKIKVIAVTGTKGKSSTVEILNAILEKAGNKTALSNTIRFKVGDESRRNLFKMSMPGRMSMQKLIREAVIAGCKYIVIEMTSQGALLFRHRFVELDTLVFTNLSPEHIEAHGSYEKYLESKLAIARNMSRSNKNTTLIVNADDPEGKKFLECKANAKISYSIKDGQPYTLKESGIDYTYGGKTVQTKLSGLFNLYNILAASAAAKSEGISTELIASAVESIEGIQGRVEKVEAGQDFTVVVDYAHTADSLEKLYKVFPSQRLIAVLGGTGGGRDTSKRAIMGQLADKYCDVVIVTNEDPYDEDPRKIIEDVAQGVTSKKPLLIMDRQLAIAAAIQEARKGDVVLITGKGTDPYIMGKNGSKTPWSDADTARSALLNLGRIKQI